MALFSTAKEKATVRRASYQTGLLAAQDLEEIESGKARAQAGEESALAIFNRLGAPGSFDAPSTTSMAPTDIYDTTGPLSKKSAAAQGLLSKYSRLKKDAQGNPIGVDSRSSKYGSGAQTLFDPRQGILDPEKYANSVGQSAQFRIQSRQTAEAEQLLKQEGPAWDMLYNSTIGRIYESAALQNREAMRTVRDGLAKGGTARRTAFAQAQELIQIERAHQMRTQQTWVANEELHKYIRQNADRVQNSNIKFLDNLPELRKSYADTMRALSNMLTGQVVPGATAAINTAASSVAAVQAKDGAFLEGLIMTGVTAVAGAAIGYATGGDEGVVKNTIGSSNISTSLGNIIPGFNNAEFTDPGLGASNQSSAGSGRSWKDAAAGASRALFGGGK